MVHMGLWRHMNDVMDRHSNKAVLLSGDIRTELEGHFARERKPRFSLTWEKTWVFSQLLENLGFLEKTQVFSGIFKFSQKTQVVWVKTWVFSRKPRFSPANPGFLQKTQRKKYSLQFFLMSLWSAGNIYQTSVVLLRMGAFFSNPFFWEWIKRKIKKQKKWQTKTISHPSQTTS